MKETIYRQDAIDEFMELEIEIRPSAIDKIIKMLETLPSAQTERKGKWIRDETYYPRYHCSNCGEKTDNTIMGTPRYNYCPNCGYRMER